MGASTGQIDRVQHLPARRGLGDVARCIAATIRLLGARRVHLPDDNVDRTIRFADGTSGRVYRETVLDTDDVADPVTLIVGFRLRWIGSNRFAHAVFRVESMLNTPLFVGFPGFGSKLWIADDGHNLYRGIYTWDGEELARAYVRALWWPLALVSERSSICFHVVPGAGRDQTLSDLDPGFGAQEWWRPTSAGSERNPG